MAGLTYATREHYERDRGDMQKLLDALNASYTTLRLDDCQAWTITGTRGCIRSYGPIAAEIGWQIILDYETVRAENFAEKRIPFCRPPPIGSGLLLDHLPTPAEAAAIRRAVGIRKRLPPGIGFFSKPALGPDGATVNGSTGAPLP